MKINRIKTLKVNSFTFKVVWDHKRGGASLSYPELEIVIGCKVKDEGVLLNYICHELWELVAIETHVRLHRPDVEDDFIFVYDHRQHDLMVNMFASLLSQFIK